MLRVVTLRKKELPTARTPPPKAPVMKADNVLPHIHPTLATYRPVLQRIFAALFTAVLSTRQVLTSIFGVEELAAPSPHARLHGFRGAW